MMLPVSFTSNSDGDSLLKHFATILAMIAIFAVLLNIATFIFRPAHIDHCANGIQAFEDWPENSVEVLVIGSSHAWRGVDTAWLYKQYGIKAYNYGCNWQCLSTEELFLRNALRRQNPKVVLFETYRINDVLRDVDMEGEIYYTRYLPWSRAKIRYIQKAFGDFGKHAERYISYLFPLAQFHSGWDSLEERNFKKEDTYTKEYILGKRGYLQIDVDTPCSVSFETYQKKNQKPLDKDTVDILEGLVEECKRRDISLVFFTVPYQGSNRYHDAMMNFSKNNGCDYIDFFYIYNEVGIDQKNDFADSAHMTPDGAIKISNYLGNYLRDSYGFL